MTRKNRKLLLWRILLCILIVCNMAVVFLFSSQSAKNSASLSKRITISVVEWVSKLIKEEKTTTQAPIEEEITPPLADVTIPEPEATTPEPEVTTPEPGTTTPEPGTTKPEPGTTTPEPEETTPEPEETTPEPEETTPEPEVTTPEEPKPKDPMEHLTEEQKVIVNKAHTPIRKLAHMLEFGSLGALALLLLITWPGKLLWRYFASLGFTLLYAATDEMHQLFIDGRGARLSDVFIDFTGAFITCTLLLALVAAIRCSHRLVTTHYNISISPDQKPLTLALVADLHGCPHQKLVERLRAASPDKILLAGDLMEDDELADKNSSGYAFLRACAEIAPTYYSLGNHETIGAGKKGMLTSVNVLERVRETVSQTGVVLLHNESVLADGIRICGLTSGLTKEENRPNEEALAEFANAPEFRILLCHHPEYYEPYIRNTNIELTVCGHAHGGQWRFFGHGIFAPGQGIFPKYTAGVIDGRCIISRGTGDHTPIPRVANPRELVIIHCEAKTEDQSSNKEKEKEKQKWQLLQLLSKILKTK